VNDAFGRKEVDSQEKNKRGIINGKEEFFSETFCFQKKAPPQIIMVSLRYEGGSFYEAMRSGDQSAMCEDGMRLKRRKKTQKHQYHQKPAGHFSLRSVSYSH
jgi:hypothetical protein